MEGWTEDEIRNNYLMAPCGLYCGACAVYIATRDKNEKLRQVMCNLCGTKPEETVCLGCMQPEPPKEIYGYCQMCSIRNCVRSKGFYSCHQCTDWPCDMIENFGFAPGMIWSDMMKNSIPIWREKVSLLGDEKGSVEWARSVCERYHCSSCGKPLFRGAQRCRHCKSPVADDLDGSL